MLSQTGQDGLWDSPGALLGLSWALLEPSWALLGSLEVPGVPRAHPELGSYEISEMAPIPHRSSIFVFFGVLELSGGSLKLFGSLLGRSGGCLELSGNS